MRKITIILSLICSTLAIQIPAEEIKISPELDAFMELKSIDSNILENNLYVGLIGFYLPQDNFIELTENFFKTNDEIGLNRVANGYLTRDPLAGDLLQRTLEAMNQPDSIANFLADSKGLLKIEDIIPNNQPMLKVNIAPFSDKAPSQSDDYFPCISYLNKNCLATMADRKAYIQQTISDNQRFLDRFDQLARNSTHISVGPPHDTLCR